MCQQDRAERRAPWVGATRWLDFTERLVSAMVAPVMSERDASAPVELTQAVTPTMPEAGVPPLCDFCERSPHEHPAVWAYPVGQLTMMLGGAEVLTDVEGLSVVVGATPVAMEIPGAMGGPWRACEQCGALIEAEDYVGLSELNVYGLGAGAHARFRRGRAGERVALDGGAA